MQESKALTREASAASAASMASDARTEARALPASQAEHASACQVEEPSREACETQWCDSQLSQHLSRLQASAVSAASVSAEAWTGSTTDPGAVLLGWGAVCTYCLLGGWPGQTTSQQGQVLAHVLG